MLELYIREYPDDIEFISDVDSYFLNSHLKNDEYTRSVLANIEKAQIVDEFSFKERTGTVLRSGCLSTSTKCLLLLHYFPNVIVNCDEIGNNALAMVKEGKLFFSTANRDLPNGLQVMYKGNLYSTDELNYKLSLED